MAGPTVEERISGIFKRISERVDSARRSAQIGLEPENVPLDPKYGESSENERIASLISGFRVWPDGVSPETLILTLEARLFANERLVSALAAQLVEHVVLGEDMLRQLAKARGKLDIDLSPVMAKFMARLAAAGVKGDHVRFLSKKRMMDVLAAIWGSTPDGIADRVGDVLDAVTDERTVSEQVGENIGEPSAVRSSTPAEPANREPGGGFENADRGPVITADDAPPNGHRNPTITPDVPTEVTGSTIVAPAINLSVPTRYWPYNPTGAKLERGQVVVNASLPALPSSQEVFVETGLVAGERAPLDITATGYVATEWMAFNVRDLEPRKFRLPDGFSMSAMALPGSEEDKLARLAETKNDPIAARKFVEVHAARNGWPLSEEEVRLWLFLLYEVPVATTNSRSPGLLGGGGWYDGVRVPAKPREVFVRVLRRIDEADLGRVPSVAELAGKAVVA